jgi:hypothetical protein
VMVADSATLWPNSSMKGTKGGRKGYRNKSHQLDVIVRDKINCLAKLQVRVPWSSAGLWSSIVVIGQALGICCQIHSSRLV